MLNNITKLNKSKTNITASCNMNYITHLKNSHFTKKENSHFTNFTNIDCTFYERIITAILILSSFIVYEICIISNKSYGVEKFKEIRLKHINNIIIGSLNINSIASKFDELKLIINDNLDILILNETKLGNSFPESQFSINGLEKPFRLDRNENGEG